MPQTPPAADPFDPLVVNPGRLSILTALAAAEGTAAEFVDVRRLTRLTDGNLASHAKRLADGGLIGIDKRFRDGKPVTSYLLMPAGREALSTHVRRVTAAVAGPSEDPERESIGGHVVPEVRVAGVVGGAAEALPEPVFAVDDGETDWVD